MADPTPFFQICLWNPFRVSHATTPQNCTLPPYPAYVVTSNDFPYHLFKKWVRIIIQRGIEQLYIEIPRALEVPHIIWSCKTLVVLKLYRLSMDVFVKVHMPALKTLHLDFLFISKSQYFAEIFHGCPNLEDFRAYHIFLDNKLEGIEFQTMPKLVKADLKLDYVFEFPLKVVSNVEHLRFFLKV
ncbi:hypothetical protein ACSQ67_016468 [Phaseolus vulgaris]